MELCAPESQEPGTYQGALHVKAEGKPLAPVPFTAEVQPFVLPATSSLPNSFGISLYSISRAHGLKPESPEARQLLHDYAGALLAHRLSAHGMSMNAPPVRFEDGQAVVDFSAYDAELGPFLDGSALPSGARFTTAEVRDSKSAAAPTRRSPRTTAPSPSTSARRAGRRGSSSTPRTSPNPRTWRSCAPRRCGCARPSGTCRCSSPPRWMTRCVARRTSSPPPSTASSPAPGPRRAATSSPCHELRRELDPHVKVWWYQSCNSHGCNGGPTPDAAAEKVYSGWASYMVDHPTPLNRAMGPLAFLSGVDGELYFDTVFAYNTKDPWQDVFEFGGNGDGTLFYPGTPARPGFSRHQPVVSLRLKHIRDGLEDYEYLRLLESLGEQTFAREAARRLTRSGYEVETDSRQWEQVRREMTLRLRKRWEASEYVKRSGVRPK